MIRAMGSVTLWGAARPSVLGGVASILDLGNNLSEYNTIPADVYDTFQLAHDWRMIGDDLRSVLLIQAREIERRRGRAAAGAV